MRYPQNKRLGLGVRTSLVFAAAIWSASVHAADRNADLKWSKDASIECSFVAPASLGDGPKSWIGSCPGGSEAKATGIGMLRTRNGDKPGPAFYGEMRAGVPIIGVVDDGNGYQAGLFANGDIGLGDQEKQDVTDSFEFAVIAAKRVSEHYAAQKNAASAKYYKDVAKKLDKQLDAD